MLIIKDELVKLMIMFVVAAVFVGGRWGIRVWVRPRIHSFIHYGDLYSAPSRLLLRSAPDPCTAKKKSFETRVECVIKNPGKQSLRQRKPIPHRGTNHRECEYIRTPLNLEVVECFESDNMATFSAIFLATGFGSPVVSYL